MLLVSYEAVMGGAGLDYEKNSAGEKNFNVSERKVHDYARNKAENEVRSKAQVAEGLRLGH